MTINDLATVKGSQPIRVRYNTGTIFDILTGRYVTGQKGESILNGGVSGFNGFCAAPNMFKSVLMHMTGTSLIENYPMASYIPYECESSGEMARIRESSKHTAPSIYKLTPEEFLTHPNIMMTDVSNYNGTEFWALVGSLYENRLKKEKEYRLQTPFVGKEGKPIEVMSPLVISIDSLSVFSTGAVEDMSAENEIGTAGQNMRVMRGGMGKTQLLMDIPLFTARTGLIFSMTAHMGEKYSLDPYAPKINKLNFLSNHIKLKFVPEQFTYLPNNLWWVMGSAPLYKAKSKVPEYPREGEQDKENDTDLMLLTITNLRGKSGPSGLPLEIVVSQSEGFLPHLTWFRYIKEYDVENAPGYGLSGNRDWWSLDIYPDVKLSRSTVRTKLENDPLLRRAVAITGELGFIAERDHHIAEGLLCTPKELFDDLTKQGHDWKKLLSTRSVWRFDQYSNEIPFLSTLDLLRMRAGLYTPYWY